MSIKEEFMKLRQVLRHLRPTFTDNDGVGLLRTVWALWEKWLSLLEVAKEWEMWCEELKQEWKFVNEEVSASFSLFVNPYLRLFFFSLICERETCRLDASCMCPDLQPRYVPWTGNGTRDPLVCGRCSNH